MAQVTTETPAAQTLREKYDRHLDYPLPCLTRKERIEYVSQVTSMRVCEILVIGYGVYYFYYGMEKPFINNDSRLNISYQAISSMLYMVMLLTIQGVRPRWLLSLREPYSILIVLANLQMQAYGIAYSLYQASGLTVNNFHYLALVILTVAVTAVGLIVQKLQYVLFPCCFSVVAGCVLAVTTSAGLGFLLYYFVYQQLMLKALAIVSGIACFFVILHVINAQQIIENPPAAPRAHWTTLIFFQLEIFDQITQPYYQLLIFCSSKFCKDQLAAGSDDKGNLPTIEAIKSEQERQKNELQDSVSSATCSTCCAEEQNPSQIMVEYVLGPRKRRPAQEDPSILHQVSIKMGENQDSNRSGKLSRSGQDSGRQMQEPAANLSVVGQQEGLSESRIEPNADLLRNQSGANPQLYQEMSRNFKSITDSAKTPMQNYSEAAGQQQMPLQGSIAVSRYVESLQLARTQYQQPQQDLLQQYLPSQRPSLVSRYQMQNQVIKTDEGEDGSEKPKSSVALLPQAQGTQYRDPYHFGNPKNRIPRLQSPSKRVQYVKK